MAPQAPADPTSDFSTEPLQVFFSYFVKGLEKDQTYYEHRQKYWEHQPHYYENCHGINRLVNQISQRIKRGSIKESIEKSD